MLGVSPDIVRARKPILQPAKPWSEFFLYLRFRFENGALKRIENNVNYFQTNYIIIFIAILCLSVFKSVIVLFVVPMFLFLWWFVWYNKRGDYVIGKFRIGKNLIILSVMILILFSIIISGNWGSIFFSSIFSTILILIHSSLCVRNSRVIIVEPKEIKRSNYYDPNSTSKYRNFQNLGSSSTTTTSQPLSSSSASMTTSRYSENMGMGMGINNMNKTSGLTQIYNADDDDNDNEDNDNENENESYQKNNHTNFSSGSSLNQPLKMNEREIEKKTINNNNMGMEINENNQSKSNSFSNQVYSSSSSTIKRKRNIKEIKNRIRNKFGLK